MKSMGARAAPMPAQQRRDAVIDAALPLLRKHGDAVTTKQIADAAGIAEGTIFRVFPDKDSLITAVIAKVFDPEPTIEAMRAIDRSLPLRERLAAAIHIITARLDSVWELMSAMRMMGAPEQNARLRPALASHHLDDQLSQALIALLEPDQHQFRVDPAQVARILRLLTFAGSHPRITEGNPLTSDEIIDLLMDGLRAHSPSPPLSCQPAVPAVSVASDTI